MVTPKFKKFCSDIAISSSTQSDISYRYKRITKQLNIDFWGSTSDTDNSLYVGSYGRGTAIHVSDIDMLMRLPVSYYSQYNAQYGNGQSALLQAVRNSLRSTYSTTHLKGDGQVVVVAFNDNIKFEILPCFINKDNTSFTYPDTHSGGRWKVTNPQPEIRAIKSSNEALNYNLKRLCRMARAWKDNWDVPIGGLLIDTLSYNFLSQWRYREKTFEYYDWMVRDFFYYLKNQESIQQYWLAIGSSHRIYREGNFEHKALRCHNISVEAIEYENSGFSWSANQKWREIFGTKFTR